MLVKSSNDLYQNSNSSKIENFILWFSAIDIFFLPYFRFMSVSFSVPIMAIWMALHYKEMLRGREAPAFFLMACFMIAGTIAGAVYPGALRWETEYSTTVKRLFQYLICFGYYFFYRYYFRKSKLNINKLLLAFSIIATLYAVFFLISPRNYANLKIFINPVDNHTARYLAGTHFYRFNYLWTDPNNIAYLADGIVLWFILDKEESFTNRILILLLSSVIILATSSNGGMAILGIELIIIIMLKLIELRNNSRLRASTFFGVIVVIITGLLIIRFTSLYELLQVNLIEKWSARWAYYSSSSNISGGRINDLKEAIKYLNPMFILAGSGKEGFSTENGHIYWIGMYGLPAYLGFLYLCFAKFKYVPWTRYIWILPFFFAFSFNIAIGEFKWLAIYLMLLAYSRYSFAYDYS